MTDPTCNENGSLYGEPNKPGKYVAPTICIGDLDYSKGCDALQEQYANEAISLTGQTLHIYKLLGVHEQGKLVDLAGHGKPLNGSENAFNAFLPTYLSSETGVDVLTTPAWLGYDFGTIKTSYGAEMYSAGQPNAINVNSFQITQPNQNRRALQVRVERSLGELDLEAAIVTRSGNGNGQVSSLAFGIDPQIGTCLINFVNATSFYVFLSTASASLFLGSGNVDKRFVSDKLSFLIKAGDVPFASGSLISFNVQFKWLRVDVVNLPNDAAESDIIKLKISSASRYWRIVPISFSGVATNEPWEVSSLRIYNWEVTDISNIQDKFLLENRDRDYSPAPINLKATYTPFDAISDFSKFGFQIAEQYAFTGGFATIIAALGRPLVIGDIIELPSEMQYDVNLNPVLKFLEVTDTHWATEGFTTAWRPVLFKFQASPIIPSQEHRDIIGTVYTKKYNVDDSTFYDGIKQIQTDPLTMSENISADAGRAVPEAGINTRETMSGLNRFSEPGSYEGVGIYAEDALPPDGYAYTEGFKLPDKKTSLDGQFFRLNYDEFLKIPSRLYQFNSSKNKWILIETDKRNHQQSHKPTQQVEFAKDSRTTLTAMGTPTND